MSTASKGQFLQPPPNNWICPFCEEVVVNPYQVNCCGHVYCKECIKQMELCYHCDSFHDITKCFYDKRAAMEIGSLMVRCTMHQLGCKWEGELLVLPRHTKNSCEYGSVTCQDCGMSFMRYLLENHKFHDCPERLATCEYCKMGMKKELLFSHYATCTHYPTLCPNKGCTEEIKRSGMAHHLLDCPYGEAVCLYHSVGCHSELIKKCVSEHNEKCSEQHLQLVINRIKELEMVRQHSSTFSCKLSRFKQMKEKNEEWYSPGFYSSKGGFKMCLNVYPNGLDSAKGTHLSCFIRLMPGEYDDTLEWPFRGEVTIELLNLLEDKHHFKGVILFTNNMPEKYCERVVDKEHGLGWGIPKFLSLEELHHPSPKNCQYIEMKEGLLFFRLSVNCRSKTRPWLQTEVHV